MRAPMISSAAKMAKLSRSRRQVFLALFIALAVSLHLLEALLPSPLPWFRLGLANVMTLAALYVYDSRGAWIVSLARVGIGALLLGRIFGPGFWLALAGTILATFVMIIMYRFLGRFLSPVGVSAAGASGHVLGQVLIARWMVIQHEAVWQVFPVLLLSAIVSGTLTGWLAAALIEHLKKHPAFQLEGSELVT